MKRLIQLFALMLVVAFSASAQINTNRLRYVAVSPSGACGNGVVEYNFTDNTLWGCENGTWTEISGGGGGSGTVTVVGAGSLTSTAIVTGGGTTTIQTPSATSTLDASGNMVLAGSLSAGGGACVALTGGTAGATCMNAGTAPTGIGSTAILYPDATGANVLAKLNNGTADTVCFQTLANCGGTTYVSSGVGIFSWPSWGGNVQTGAAYNASKVYINEVTFPNGSYDKIGVRLVAASGTCGGTCGAVMCVYAQGGGSLLGSSAVVTSGGTPDLNSGAQWLPFTFASPLTLNGVYWVGFTTTSTSLTLQIPADSVAMGLFANTVYGFGLAKEGTAANNNSGTGGSLACPATTGALTASNNPTTPAFVAWRN